MKSNLWAIRVHLRRVFRTRRADSHERTNLNAVAAFALALLFCLPSGAAANCTEVTDLIDFESLSEGQLVGNGTLGAGINVTVNNKNSSHPDQAIIFDSSCPGGCSGNDPDLETPGFGTGNDTAQGKILIIAEDVVDVAPADGLVDDPDDEAAGGSITIDFPSLRRLSSFRVVDGEESGGSVVVTNTATSESQTIPIPVVGDGGATTITVDNPIEADQVTVNLAGSGAIDDFLFVLPSCGDCNVDSGEQCDDGNTDNNDGCDSTCQAESCCKDGTKIESVFWEFDHPLVASASSITVTTSRKCNDFTSGTDVEVYTGSAPVDDGPASDSRVGDLVIESVVGQTLTLSTTRLPKLQANVGLEVSFPTGEVFTTCPHTSCSQPIYEGQVTDTYFTVVDIQGQGLQEACEETCGNGLLEYGEECDDGNVEDGDCCSSTCNYDSAGTSCSDGNACNGDETCDGAGECIEDDNIECHDGNGCTDDTCEPASGCVFTPNTDPCNDGNACTTNDTCSGGTCVGDVPPICDDGNPCTTDSCSVTEGCKNTDNTASCDDGDACTTNDTCSGGSCVGGAAPDCDDGNVCTTDTCDSGSGCVNANNGASCDDGDACTTNDTCSGGSCVGGAAPDCDDGNVCTTDTCDSGSGCVNANNGASCDDGNACTTNDTCSGGVCVGGAAPDCDDGNVCTTDTCDSGSGCVNTNNTASCDDGDACTTNDTCSGGSCVGGAAPDCDDGNVCTTDTCDSGSGCVNANNTASCDDGNACTTNDTCSGGSCVGGAAPDCDDGNVCTTDTCDSGSGCVNANNTASCDDGDACTTNDTCSGGSCVGGAAPDCDDGNVCTTDTCDSGSGCVNSNNTASCDDGSACTTNDTCSGGSCVGGAAPDCDDGDVCTDDSCDAGSGCETAFNTAPCDDGDPDTIDDTCSNGVCAGVAAPSCHDGNPCTDDSYDAGSGSCVNVNNTASCDDGNACTTNDLCSGGSCVGGAAPDCDDGNVCTTDTCDSGSGCVNTNNTTSCDDGNACTTNDLCSGGSCVGGAAPDCDDGNACTTDTCDAGSGCVNTNNTASCDDGDACTTNDTCSGGSCIGGAAPDCDDGNVCTTDTCDAGSGCVNTNNTASCHDGDACTTNDTCSGGSCVGGAAPDCDDGNVCTTDTCDSGSGCVNTNNTASCDDGNACTTNDLCSGGSCVGGAAPDCDDGNVCTDDSCDSGSGCETANNTASCDDGDPDTINDTCTDGVCAGVAAPSCNDGNPCTDDSYDVGSGSCVNVNNTASCDDGNACTTNDVCSGGSCIGGAAPDCDDGNVCTTDTCDSGSGCVNTNNTASCDDGDACTTNDTCSGGSCAGGAPPDCDDGNVCTTDTCDSGSGCVNANNGASCDDGDACTTNDTCSGGSCVGGAAPDCDDGNVCTTDTCDSGSGCVNADNTASCDDGNACTTNDTCSGGVCVGGSAPDCDDGIACTIDVCDAILGCVNTPDTCSGDCGDGIVDLGEECDDGNDNRNDACTNDCLIARCGDGIVYIGFEECDWGGSMSDTVPDACRTDCMRADCGDSVIDTGETCDDGNVLPGDGCDASCAVEAPTTTVTTTSTTTTTTIAVCGNGIVEGSEDCDDGNLIDDDGCYNDCTAPVCGDGIVEFGETCDDGNNTRGDGCDHRCRPEEACMGAIAWNDINGDGIKGINEPKISGVVVNLYTALDPDWTPPLTRSSDVVYPPGVLTQTFVTGIGGDALFIDIPAAAYWLEFIVPAGFLVSPKDVGSDDDNDSDVDSLTFRTPPIALGPTDIVHNFALGMRVCGNGVLEPSEACDDGNNNNGDGCSSTCLIEGDSDLEVLKSDSPDAVAAGTMLAYQLTVINHGPQDAGHVTVVDVLDPNTAFVSASDPACIESPVGTITCDFGTLPAGDSLTFDINVLVDINAPIGSTIQHGNCTGAEDICNTVSVSTSTNDPNPTNDDEDEPTDVVDPAGPIPSATCGDGVVEGLEQCDPPNSEDCGNGFDDDGDGRVDCDDPDCPSGPTAPTTCSLTCQEVPACQPLLDDPQFIKFGRNGKPGQLKIHARFIPQGDVDLTVDPLTFIIMNEFGVIYRATLYPEDLQKHSTDTRWRFKDRGAKKGLGIRSGWSQLLLSQKAVDGVDNNFVFKIKAYGDFSRATVPTMTTQFIIGNNVGTLTADWKGKYGSKWKLTLRDFLAQQGQ